MDKYCQFSKNV